MRNRLYEAKSVFEGGNVALLNCFSMVSRRRFVSSGNGSGAVEVTTSGGWGCGQTREIAWFAKGRILYKNKFSHFSKIFSHKRN